MINEIYEIYEALKKDFLHLLKTKEYHSQQVTSNPELLTQIVLERNKKILTKTFLKNTCFLDVHNFLFD